MNAIKPYIELTRLHYFIGPNVLSWAFAYGLTLGAIETSMPLRSYGKQLIVYHLVGGLLLHSVGSIWDDICDRNLDSQVERTKGRPIASGRVTVNRALLFLLPQVLLLVGILRLTNNLSFNFGVFGLFTWVTTYPFMKRITYWPQAWLGIAGNWGILVAYAAITNRIDSVPAWMLFFGSICWCTHFDTVYGMMDKKDDAKVGIKSTALLFGEHARAILSLFCSAFLFSLTGVGITLHASFSYYVLAVATTGAHLAWQLLTVDFESQNSCFRVFISNSTQLGYLVWLGLMGVYLEKLGWTVL